MSDYPVRQSSAGLQLESYQIENENASFTALSMNAEFNSSLSPFVLGGSTVAAASDLITKQTTPRADLTTRPGSVLLQPAEGTADSKYAMIYQALSLGVGEEIVVSLGAPYAMGAQSNNEIHYGVSFNDATTSHKDGTYDRIYYDGGDDALTHWNGAVKVAEMHDSFHPGCRLYWRFVRETNNVLVSFSLTGDAWCAFSEFNTVSRGHDYMWIFYNVTGLAGSDLASPMEVRWCRHKSYSGTYPW